MRSVLVIISLLFLTLTVKAQQDAYENEYPTKLEGGYSIAFKTDDSTDYLYLKKGTKLVAELSSGSKGMLYKNLGYLGADFQDYFVLVESFGSGNPHMIQLFKKSTGKNILKRDACWIDADAKGGFLLYTYGGMPSSLREKMILYNVVTKRKRYLNFPVEVFKEDYLDINIVKVNDSLLTIKYSTEHGDKRKTYRW
jgi:hypothetical protein